MSAYTVPASGGLQFSMLGRTFNLFIAEMGGEFELVLTENVTGDLVGRWYTSLLSEQDLRTDIMTLGSIEAWIAKFIDAINAAFKSLFTVATPPAPGASLPASTADLVAAINNSLAANFTIVAGTAGFPVFGHN